MDDRDLLIDYLTEALAQATKHREQQAERINALERENEALQGDRRVLLTLTDRGDLADGYCVECGSGGALVRELEAFG